MKGYTHVKLPCPFCGNEEIRIDDFSHVLALAFCPKCHSEAPVSEWDNRVLDKKTAASLEKYRQLAQRIVGTMDTLYHALIVILGDHNKLVDKIRFTWYSAEDISCGLAELLKVKETND